MTRPTQSVPGPIRSLQENKQQTRQSFAWLFKEINALSVQGLDDVIEATTENDLPYLAQSAAVILGEIIKYRAAREG
jgi:hypothetical protein